MTEVTSKKYRGLRVFRWILLGIGAVFVALTLLMAWAGFVESPRIFISAATVGLNSATMFILAYSIGKTIKFRESIDELNRSTQELNKAADELERSFKVN